MIVAISSAKGAKHVLERFAERGHTCIETLGILPAEAECLVLVGEEADAGSLEASAKAAGLPCLRIAARLCDDADQSEASRLAEAADAAAWGLSIADRLELKADLSEVRIARLENIRVKMAEQRSLELSTANELLQARAVELTATLGRLDVANRQLMDELNLASELQKSLLPRSYPSDVPLEFAHKFIPLNSIGGDLFDVIRLDERTLSIMIADVSGHGVGPALVTAMYKSSFGLESRAIRSPAALMSALNEEMCGVLTTGHYVTSFCAIIDTETLEMRYCSAGHPNQLLIRADGTATELATMGFLLGMMEGMDYEEKSVTLEPGDSVAFFTDGVLESANGEASLFGREGIVKSMVSRLGAGPIELSNGILSDLLGWTEGIEANDDLTLLIAQVLESL